VGLQAALPEVHIFCGSFLFIGFLYLAEFIRSTFASFAIGVKDMLAEVVASKQGISMAEAGVVVQRLGTERRILEDVWG
jgi:hypothetical protein